MKKKFQKYMWENGFELKIQVLDDQHKKFIAILNLLVDAINQDEVNKKIPQIFFKLMNHAEDYFLQEEILLKKYPESNLDDIQKDHQDFIIRIANFQNQFSKKEESIASDLLEFLDSWLKNRINNYNKQTIFYLQTGTK
ncbi:bacteriohemerythrin [Ancylomarina longa]|uniref:Hemerythrin-like domain-containing protein n=1 Tax=Ancylomarina longa TaxID=2487017 RepID=A0A434ATQ8_9BACT|nr:hemerythrin family protein [Ancylomarina longa]RUT77706.1 hypothetical protein DLK05_11600 [Ancylomarina longa]